jgi:hypothetical protein
MTIPNINIDTILSDPMMLVGVGLVVFGALLFLISFWKFATYNRRQAAKNFVVPQEEEPMETPVEVEPEVEVRGEINVPPAPEPEPVASASSHQNGAREEQAQDKTVVIQPQEADMQMQLDIIVSQLKNLNRKVSELEEKVENPAGGTPSVDENLLKEPPANAEDYSKKLLTLAEHVIMLEKEVTRLKGSKPPIMPI